MPATKSWLAGSIEILEKGPTWVQCPVLNIIYCLLHYTDLTGPPHTAAVNAEVLTAIAKYMDVSVPSRQEQSNGGCVKYLCSGCALRVSRVDVY